MSKPRVSEDQLRIFTDARFEMDYRWRVKDMKGLTTMYEIAGHGGVTVGLCYTEAGHTYLVRERIGPHTPGHLVRQVCMRVWMTMANLRTGVIQSERRQWRGERHPSC